VYESLAGTAFVVPDTTNIAARIETNLERALQETA
jgi:hypothetical protein